MSARNFPAELYPTRYPALENDARTRKHAYPNENARTYAQTVRARTQAHTNAVTHVRTHARTNARTYACSRNTRPTSGLVRFDVGESENFFVCGFARDLRCDRPEASVLQAEAVEEDGVQRLAEARRGGGADRRRPRRGRGGGGGGGGWG